MDGDVLTIDVQKTEGQEAEDEQDGVKCAFLTNAASKPVQLAGTVQAVMQQCAYICAASQC